MERIHREQQRMMMLDENRMEVDYLRGKKKIKDIELVDFFSHLDKQMHHLMISLDVLDDVMMQSRIPNSLVLYPDQLIVD